MTRKRCYMVVMGNKKTKSFTNDDFYDDNEL